MGNPPFEDVSPLKKMVVFPCYVSLREGNCLLWSSIFQLPPKISLPRIYLQFSLTGSQDAAAFFTFAVASNFSWESKNASISSTGEAP